MSVFMRAALVATTLVVVGCHKNDKNNNENELPDYIRSAIASTTYDGTTDDLLTAGLGKAGLAGAPVVPAVPASPTTAELRKIAIWNNYRALVDIRQQDERVWRHLKDSIKKGFDCLYSSEPPLVWSV